MEVLSEVATAVADHDVTGKRLRLKVLVKKPAIGTCKPPQLPEVDRLNKPQIIRGRTNAVSGVKKPNSTLGVKHVIGACEFSKQFQKSSITGIRMSTVIVNKKFNSVAGCKRKSEEVLESHESKRLKMDRSATNHCRAVLDKLMSHELSCLFHTPVNPDDWKIYDYFDIIKKPMDLGTIRRKLLQHKYNGVEEFEADVRLTFSNAMLYNPPGNWFHESAKTLVKVFESLWKPANLKMEEHEDVKQRGPESSLDKATSDVKDKCLVRHETFRVLSTPEIHPQGKGLLSPTSHLNQLPGKAMTQTERSPGDLKKPLVERQRDDLKAVKDGKPIGSLSSKTYSDCRPRDSLSSKTYSDFAGSVSRLHKSASPMSAKVKYGDAPAKKIGHDDFNGVMDVDHNCADFPSATGSVGATAKGFKTVPDVELSPSRALRVARLKSRFAETILKAQHHTLLEPGGETDKTIWQQEKEIMQRRQHKEKAKIEAQIRAAQSAARLKEESELKRQRQEAREAARMAIQKMEQSVDTDDNLQVLKDLEGLIGSSLVVVCHDPRFHATVWSHHVDSDKLGSPLERLGLYIKEEYRTGDYDDDDCSFLEERDQEEGEFIC